MKNNADAKKDQTPKAKAPKANRKPSAKVLKGTKADVEPVDRLPGNVEELKATKSGLVSFLFLSGKAKEEIAKELKAAFKLPDVQAVKITRRIVGRARFFQRALSLLTAK
jgi:hypothetical protein